MNTSLNKSLSKFARRANKEHPSVHSTAEIKRAIKALVIPAQAGIHCVLRTLLFAL